MINITPENAQSMLNALIAKNGHVDSARGDSARTADPADDNRSDPQSAPQPVGMPDPTDVPGLLAGWESCARGLLDAPYAALTERQLTDQLLEAARLRRVSDAAYLRLVAEVDARSAAPSSSIGAASTANLLSAGCGIAPGRAKSDVDDAHALYTSTVETSALVPTCTPGPLAGMAELLESGAIQVAHVDTAVRTLERIPERLLRVRSDDADRPEAQSPDAGNTAGEVDEQVAETLVGFFATHAPTVGPRTLANLSEELIRQIAPPTDDLFDPEAFNRRDLGISTDLAGMVHGSYQLDADAGGLFASIIDALSAPRPGETSDDGNDTVRDTRRPGQRRADALTEIIRLAAARLGIGGPSVDGAEDTSASQDGGPRVGGSQDGGSQDGGHRVGGSRDSGPQDLGLFDLEIGDGVPDGGKTSGSDGGGSDGGTRNSRVGTSRAGRLRAGRRAPHIVIVSSEQQVRAHRHEGDDGAGPAGTNSDGTDCRWSPEDPSRSYSPGLGPVDAGMVARTACDAVFERLALDKNRAILDLGTGVRLATPAQRRALEARDQGCTFPGCNRPASWCDAHHVIWFSRGGPTSTGNLALLCPAHHSLIHTGQWTMMMIDGIPYARPAPGNRASAIYGTAVSEGGWIRNTYFDALRDARSIAARIRHLA